MNKKLIVCFLAFCSLKGFVFGDNFSEKTPVTLTKDATLSARTCSCAHVYVTGDFIYWRARGEELFYAGSTNILPAQPIGPIVIRDKEVNFEYDPGFKLGFGGNLPFDGWDLYANWTHFHNHPSSSTTSSENNLVALFVGDRGGGPVTLGTKASGSWDVNFNSLDFDWGRMLYLSHSLMIRPSFGAKAAWIAQRLHFKLENVVDQALGNPLPDERLKGTNKFWGVGPYFGLNGVWNWAEGFGLYGEISGALMWGEFKQRIHIVSNFTGGGISQLDTTSISDTYRVRPTLQMFVGLDWRSCVYKDWIALNFRAGWEVQYFWSQFLNPFGGVEESDFSLEGVTATARIDF